MTDRAWWTQLDGVPLGRPDALSRGIAAGFLLVFVLASSGVVAARSAGGNGNNLQTFCRAYRSLPVDALTCPSGLPDIERPEVRAAITQFEQVIELGRRSGNRRVEATYADLNDVIVDATPGTTPAEVQAKAEHFADVYIASFRATVEECQKAGVPISES